MKTPLIPSSQSMIDHIFLKEIKNDKELTSIDSTQAWINENKSKIEKLLEEHGVILFSDFPITNAENFDLFVTAFNFETFTYEKSLSNAVRINKTNKVFTANEAPKEIEIFLHHEMAQTPIYPHHIFFFCKSTSEKGGETPLCRSDYLYDAIYRENESLLKNFEEYGVIYNSIMSNGDELVSGQGRSWQKTLGVKNKNDAEIKLAQLGYEWRWIEGDNLSVTTCPFKATKTLEDGSKSFFNQVIAASLGWKKNSENEMPPVRFGNGNEIDSSAIEFIAELANSLTYLRPWKENDILLVDNFRVMHGRKPFSGKKAREVLVSLTN